jgi:hypothetical protein
VGEFQKLRQTTTVTDYQDRFEEIRPRLLAKNLGLNEEFFLSSFISGLKGEIRHQVRMFKPTDLHSAIELARLQEAAIEAKKFKPWPNKPISTTPPLPNLPKTQPYNYQNSHNQPPKRGPESYPIKRLTPAEMKLRREKGLCYNCDEVYTFGHQCAKKQFYMLEGEIDSEETLEESVEETELEKDDSIEEEMTISHHALTGSMGLQTIRLRGKVKNREITILVDSGSTHNFLDPETAKFTGVAVENTNVLWVTVGGGGKICSQAKCSAFSWTMQEVEFTTEMRLLTLGGCDAVLGMQWIKEIGPILLDANQLSMSFMRQNKWITLQGIKEDSRLMLMEGKRVAGQLRKALIRAEPVVQLYSLEMEEKVDEVPSELEPILEAYSDVFTEPKSLPPNRNKDHHIPLFPNSKPINVRTYRHPFIQKNEIERIVKEMLESGVIRPSNSPFASPILLVKKKDGTWRFCLDYRELNKVTIKDKFSIPVIDELLDELHGAGIFTKLDLRAGYHQIRVAEDDIHKTAFRTHQGHYEFRVMPFGLTNAPATFQSLMNEIFQPYLRKMILVFFDDILVYSRSMQEHLEHLELALNILRQHQLFVKKSKCEFGRSELEYLGHIISSEGVATDAKKVQDMLDWPQPTTIKALRGFLGLTGYYRKFVRGYGVISKPLTVLLKKNGFKWDIAASKAFEELKQAMTTTPVLALPDFTQPFVVETDACDVGIGAVLMQQGRPLAYISKALPPRKLGLSTYEKELLAIVYAVQKWKTYLYNNRFTIKTDHQSLKFFLEQKMTTLMQQKWLSKLLGFDYEITYKKGSENVVADGLSRAVKVGEGALLAITASQPAWAEEVIESYQQDTLPMTVIPELVISNTANTDFTLQNGILRKQGRIYIGSNGTLRERLIEEAHSSAMGGHSGIKGTMKRLQPFFYWTTMNQEVTAKVTNCPVCQQCKNEHIKTPGLLQPNPIPTTPWKDIAMDFIEGLPLSLGKDAILVVVDRLTKYAHFLALSHPFTAAQIAKVFFDNIHKLHGIPATIISDRDKIFTSNFWQSLFKLVGTKLCLSTAYHPQTDGQSERVNQCLENYLRCMTRSRPGKWAAWLPMAEWWYNTNYHTTLTVTPFEALYGYKPPIFTYTTLETDSTEAKDWVTERRKVQSILKEGLVQAQSRMKQYADKNRTEREFQVGDWVYLRLQPYRQASVAIRRNLKLAPRFFGPYLVEARIGAVAYRLQLPAGSQIHPVFHVSQLKKKVGSTIVPSSTLPRTGPDGQLLVFPVAVLARKLIKRNNQAVVQFLVQWSNSNPEDATWEDASVISSQFPAFDP